MGKLANNVDGLPLRIPKRPFWTLAGALLTLTAIAAAAVCASIGFRYTASIGFRYTQHRGTAPSKFYANVTQPRGICAGVRGDAASYAGYIGLAGDAEDTPRRSFFWLFEAEEDARDAPVILTVGGGPGTTGLSRPVSGQGPCSLTANGTVPNPDRVTEKYNVLALDHPIGTGFSYGRMVNNSRDGALDVYDFLQKFYVLFPHLAKNPLVISGGSYGGKHVPNIATVIQEQNRALASDSTSSAVHINLESLMISNPTSDPMAHFRWLLYFYCELHSVYDAPTCAAMYAKLPACLDLIELSLQDAGLSERASSARRAAREACLYIAWGGDTHGVMVEDVRRRCDEEDTMECFPLFKWLEQYFRDPVTTRALGIPPFINFTALSGPVDEAFAATGDEMIPTHQLYEPLLTDGIRVLHYIGAQDGNCAWPGVFSFLTRLRTPFQREFLGAPDVPWPTADSDAATVRAVGAGAGNMTYMLISGSGHFPQQEQSALVKDITERWIENRAWF
ncbi:Alpha/Beta hydrolase protein [Mycena rosella]|uniref:carboxypeptidase C n=1 Tax=Mycena rosella TaxID=1033263 RepID=A0AAD7MC48_MYCRO|nr:Alpha/Beta hydrolase protein [Mycena rosella]